MKNMYEIEQETELYNSGSCELSKGDEKSTNSDSSEGEIISIDYVAELKGLKEAQNRKASDK